jgi:hypothetical protein
MNLDNVILRNLLMGNGLGGLDWLTLLALVAIAVFYFLAPVLGYRGSRGLVLSSLWLLVAKMGLAVLRSCLLLISLLDKGGTRSGGNSFGGGSKSSVEEETIWMLITLLESGLFILAMILFVAGLASLRRDPDGPSIRRFHEE